MTAADRIVAPSPREVERDPATRPESCPAGSAGERRCNPEFNPEDDSTWPLPTPLGPRRSILTETWLDGFGAALEMSDAFHRTGEWPEWPQ